MTEKQFYVYILSNKRYGTLYIGVTSNLGKRLYEHQYKLADGFTKKYDLKMLVYYGRHESAESALHRERNMKEWKRDWKIRLIEEQNPNWFDLTENVMKL